MRTKTLWFIPEYLQQILDGLKTLKVRVGYSNIRRLQVGYQVLLNGEYGYRVDRIGRYAIFAEMLAQEEPQAITLDVPPEQLLDVIQTIYPPKQGSVGSRGVGPCAVADNSELKKGVHFGCLVEDNIELRCDQLIGETT